MLYTHVEVRAESAQGAEVRPIFDWTAFGERLDARLTIGLVSPPRAEAELMYSAIASSLGTTQPLVRINESTDIGIRQLGSYALPRLTFGRLSPFYKVELAIGVENSPRRADVGNGDDRVAAFERSAPELLTYRNELQGGIAFVPGVLPRFTLTASARILPTHTPKYEMRANGVVYSSYERRVVDENKLEAKYALDNGLILANEFVYDPDGPFDRPQGKGRFTNIARVEYWIR